MLRWRAAIGMAGVAAALAAGIVWRIERPKQEAAAAETNQDVQEEVRQMKSQLARLEANAVMQTAVLAKQAAPGVATPGASDSSAAAGRNERTPNEMEYESQLEAKFRAQPHDRDWSEQAMATATHALSADAPSGSRLGAVECRSDSCRIESSHDNLEAFKAFVHAALLNPKRKIWNGRFSTQVIDESPSGIRAVTFFTREDRELPAPEPVTN
jgi:hypothetical protein